MFVNSISVASVVVEAASRPRHLRAWQMQKAAAAYPSCIPQAREATTNRMKWVSSRSGFRVIAAGQERKALRARAGDTSARGINHR